MKGLQFHMKIFTLFACEDRRWPAWAVSKCFAFSRKFRNEKYECSLKDKISIIQTIKNNPFFCDRKRNLIALTPHIECSRDLFVWLVDSGHTYPWCCQNKWKEVCNQMHKIKKLELKILSDLELFLDEQVKTQKMLLILFLVKEEMKS